MGFYVLRVNSSFPSLFIKNKYSLHPLSPPLKKIKNPNFTILPTSEYFLIYCWTAVSYLAWKMWNRTGGIAISGEGEKQTRDIRSSWQCHLSLGVISRGSKPSQLAWWTLTPRSTWNRSSVVLHHAEAPFPNSFLLFWNEIHSLQTRPLERSSVLDHPRRI